jgi:putative CRISPR-associated protein (TIGR02619 family)
MTRLSDRILLVSTCGTSLLTNEASAEDRAWLTKVANDVAVDTKRLESIVQRSRERLRNANKVDRQGISSELNGIGSVLSRYQPKEVSHILIHTDTAVGQAAAELVRDTLKVHTALMSSGGLRTSDLASFRTALADLTKQLDETARASRERGWSVVFNLTGGFKSINGYLHTLAMITADRCVVQFEGAAELMEIPRLPVRLAEFEEIRKHSVIFRRLAVGYKVEADAASRAPEALLMELDGAVTTSVLGDLVWARHRPKLLRDDVQDPLSSKVRVSKAVKKIFPELSEQDKVRVNEALDDFSAHIDKVKTLPNSRRFQKLQGDPVPGSTHELYVSQGKAARRLFGHFDDEGVFVFDHLDGHL